MKKENKSIVITSIISGVILIIALSALTTFGSFSSKNTITVEGIATIEAEPDLMTVYFNIETINETAVQAKNANNEILNKLIIGLAIQGFAKDELKTQSFNVYPNYEWSSGKRTENGYRATHSLKLELSSDEFDKVSEIIDTGVNSGAQISYINFELSQELQNQYKAQALELASQDAQTKADSIAAGFGKKAGKLISVETSNFGYSPWNIYEASESASYDDEAQVAKEAAMNISPSEQEITARISAKFKI